MATFQFGRALLCALLSLSLTAASCGPAECPDNGVCKTDGGECPLGDCTTPDGGDNIPRAISNMIVKVPVDLTIEATYYLPEETAQGLDGYVRRMCEQYSEMGGQEWTESVQVTVGQEVSIQLPLGYYRDSAGQPTRGVTCPGKYRLEAKNVPDGWVCGYFDMVCTEEAVDQPVDFINGFRCAHDVHGHFVEAREDPELPPWNYDVETRVDDGRVGLDDKNERFSMRYMNILTLEDGFVTPDHNTITFTDGTTRTLTRSETAP